MKLPVLNIMVKTGSFLFIVFSSIALRAKPYVEYSPLIKQAYQSAIALKIDEAEELISQIRQKEPENLARLHIENYIDFFVLFVREDEQVFKTREASKSVRLAQLQSSGLENEYTRFIQAEILLQWALIRLKFDQKLKAGSEIYEAYNLLEENLKKYPTFQESKKSLSIIHSLAESLPSWVRKVVGIRGSIKLGEAEIRSLYEKTKNPSYMYAHEVIAINAYIWYYQANKKKDAIRLIERSNLDHRQNPMAGFLKASFYLRDGDNESCLRILNECPKGKPYMPFYYLDYMKGRSLLYKLDPEAPGYIRNFIQHFGGKHYIKEAYQKLAWSKIVFSNDFVSYKREMGNCLRYGQSLVDEDQQAEKEARENKIPDPVLLKARLLYDGGYYGQAQNILIKGGYSFLGKGGENELEYTYRLGRTLQALRNYPDALNYLSRTIKLGSGSSKYYACSAALQMGLIYEEIKDYTQAKKYYNTCVKLQPSEYQNSLHQKAKSGLLRLSKKG